MGAGEYITWTSGATGDATTSTTWSGNGYYLSGSDDCVNCNDITFQSVEVSELEQRVKELEKKLKKEGKMRSLYKVYVVDPRKAGVLLDEKTVITETEEQALLKAGVAQTAEKVGLELERIDTFVEQIGEFIRPRKETQKVKMVKDDDD